MKDREGRLFKGLACLLMILAVFLACVSLADLLMPEASGKTVKKNGKLVIDCSHMDQGYVMVRASKTKKKLKVRMSTQVNNEKITLNYDLNGSGEYEVFPLQYGSGKYTFFLYENVSGKKYSEEGKVSLSADIKDPNRCFLYPNQYVNFDAKTACVKEAAKICEGMTDQAKIYAAVCKYVKNNFTYDYIKSVTVKSGVLPDIDECWKKRMGICQDLAAMTIAMLRSQGVPARLMIGTLGSGTYHAWLTAVVDGDEKFFDPTAEVGGSNKKETYTTERYY